MTTPNSPTDRMLDIHADPAFAGQFGARSANQVLENTGLHNDVPTSAGLSCNVGRAEQKLRLAAGAALITAAAIAPVNRGWRLAFAALGGTQLVTGSMRFCPLWKALGVNTCTADERRQAQLQRTWRG